MGGRSRAAEPPGSETCGRGNGKGRSPEEDGLGTWLDSAARKGTLRGCSPATICVRRSRLIWRDGAGPGTDLSGIS